LRQASASWDASYENKALLLFTVGLGLVGLDRFILMPLFPVYSKRPRSQLPGYWIDQRDIVADLGHFLHCQRRNFGQARPSLYHHSRGHPFLGARGPYRSCGRVPFAHGHTCADGPVRRGLSSGEYRCDHRGVAPVTSGTQYRHSTNGAAALRIGNRTVARDPIARCPSFLAVDISSRFDSRPDPGLVHVSGFTRHQCRCDIDACGTCRLDGDVSL